MASRKELFFAEDVDGYWFHWRLEQLEDKVNYYKTLYSQFTSRITTLVLGGVRGVLLAMQTTRAFRWFLPTLDRDRRLIVVPSGRCSKVSSISTLSKYQVTFGGGLPAGGML